MSFATWLKFLESAEKISMPFVSGKCRKVFYKFPDGQQMTEEYCSETGLVLRRAWRNCQPSLAEPEWTLELGLEPPKRNYPRFCGGDADQFVVPQNETSIAISKRMTANSIEWSLRNLPYPAEIYQVMADSAKRAIVVRAINRQHFTLSVPDLDRCGLKPQQSNISACNENRTLIISYRKPELLLEMEAQVLLLLKDVETETDVGEFLQRMLK